MSSLKLETKRIRSNLYITALYITVTLHTTATGQLSESWSVERGHLFKKDAVRPTLDSQNARLHYFLPVYKAQQIGLRSNHAANFVMCPPKFTEKWILAKSSNQSTFSWQSNGGKYKRWTNSTSSLVYRKLIYSGRPYLKGDGRYRYDCSKRSKLPAT